LQEQLDQTKDNTKELVDAINAQGGIYGALGDDLGASLESFKGLGAELQGEFDLAIDRFSLNFRTSMDWTDEDVEEMRTALGSTQADDSRYMEEYNTYRKTVTDGIVIIEDATSTFTDKMNAIADIQSLDFIEGDFISELFDETQIRSLITDSISLNNSFGDLSSSLQGVYDGVNDNYYANLELANAQKEVTSVLDGRDFSTFLKTTIDGIEDYGVTISELETQLKSDDINIQTTALATLMDATGESFANGTIDALNYLDSFELVGKAMAISTANIAEWENRNETAQDKITRLGVALEQTDLSFEALKKSGNELTESELEYLQAKDDLAVATKAITDGLQQELDLLDGTTTARELELLALSESDKLIKQSIYDRIDQNIVDEENLSLSNELYNMTHSEIEIRSKLRETIDKDNLSKFDEITAQIAQNIVDEETRIETEKLADIESDRLQGIEDTRISLQEELDLLTGTITQRELELSVLSESIKLIQEAIYVEEDRKIAIEESNNFIAESISTLESAFSSIGSTIDKLKGETSGAEYSLTSFYGSMAKTKELSESSDFEAYSEALSDTIDKSGVLFESGAFSSSQDMLFAQSVAQSQFESLEGSTLEQIDVLKLIEENTRNGSDTNIYTNETDIPSYAVGTSRVSHDQLANIHKDEIIVPAKESNAFRDGSLNIGNNDDIVKVLNDISSYLSSMKKSNDDINRNTKIS
ncbi:hypothetical protein KAU11_06490, partial [Candidatus Babeliales bacterium]|nr:hypothetical protein [Candidatus Babeliales bacterium]